MVYIIGDQHLFAHIIPTSASCTHRTMKMTITTILIILGIMMIEMIETLAQHAADRRVVVRLLADAVGVPETGLLGC